MKNVKNVIEEMEIYKKYTDLYYYTYLITDKYPKHEKQSLVVDIKHTVYNGFSNLIYAHKNYNKVERLKYLNQLDSEMKILKMLVRISYKRKYITIGNYEAWSKKITYVTNLMGGWIRTCLKQ